MIGMRFRTRRRDRPAPVDTGDPGHVPLPGYDQLDPRSICERLHWLSQIDLAAVETYERSRANRREVLDKLRYLRGSEPLPGYDALSVEQITRALAEADGRTVRAVRDYERRFGHRRHVLDEAARVLPTAPASTGDARAREEQVARVRAGFEGRETAADGLARRRSAPDA